MVQRGAHGDADSEELVPQGIRLQALVDRAPQDQAPWPDIRGGGGPRGAGGRRDLSGRLPGDIRALRSGGLRARSDIAGGRRVEDRGPREARLEVRGVLGRQLGRRDEISVRRVRAPGEGVRQLGGGETIPRPVAGGARPQGREGARAPRRRAQRVRAGLRRGGWRAQRVRGDSGLLDSRLPEEEGGEAQAAARRRRDIARGRIVGPPRRRPRRGDTL